MQMEGYLDLSARELRMALILSFSKRFPAFFLEWMGAVTRQHLKLLVKAKQAPAIIFMWLGAGSPGAGTAAKDIRFGVDARALMRRGVAELADALKVTMGPKVLGREYIRLYPGSVSEDLYPLTETMLSNTSQVQTICSDKLLVGKEEYPWKIITVLHIVLAAEDYNTEFPDLHYYHSLVHYS